MPLDTGGRSGTIGLPPSGEIALKVELQQAQRRAAILAGGFLAGLAATALQTGCAAPGLAPEISQEFSAEGLHAVRASGFEQAWVLPGAALADFSAIEIEPLDTSATQFTNTDISGTTRQQWLMTPARSDALQRLWADAATAAFAAYELDPGGDRGLRLSARLTRIAGGRSSGTTTTAGGAPAFSTGDSIEVSAEFRLHDRDGDRLLAVIRDRRTVAVEAWTRRSGAGLANLLRSWASLLHTRVSGR
jgi:hypothetical protein